MKIAGGAFARISSVNHKHLHIKIYMYVSHSDSKLKPTATTTVRRDETIQVYLLIYENSFEFGVERIVFDAVSK